MNGCPPCGEMRLNRDSTDPTMPSASRTGHAGNSQAMPVDSPHADSPQAEPSPAEPSDVHATLEYRLDAELADWLPIGVLTIFCGLFLFAMAQPDLPPPLETLGAAAAVVVGIGIVVLAILRRFRRGKPVYVLSPVGVHYRGAGMKEIVVPWHEIKAVDTIDITWLHWLAYRSQVLSSRGVVVVLVSKPFYDAHIHRGLFWRGPYWYETKFIPKGDLIQCALHSEIVSVAPCDLRAAVEARWRAFREQPKVVKPAGASVPSLAAGWRSKLRRQATPLPEPRIVAAGSPPRPISLWQAVKIALPLIGIVVAGSNLLGLWATEAQTAAYAKRKEWLEWRARFERERKESDERQKKQRQEMDDLMRRTFGR